MEFCEKLKYLRKQKNITQEELAAALFVSRTAVSKWEAGRGYPSIDSLKQISYFFSIPIDSLLTGEQMLYIAQEDNKQKEKHIYDLIFGFLDTLSIMLFFLPFFAERSDGIIKSVSLFNLTYVALYLKVLYFILISAMLFFGILFLALQNLNKTFWTVSKNKISLALNAFGILLFILSLQPYAAVYLFMFLIIKVVFLVKKR